MKKFLLPFFLAIFFFYCNENFSQSVEAGGYHSIILCSSGIVKTCGANWDGQLGDGTYNDASNPVTVSGLTGIIATAGGYYHSLALKNDGTVWAWGYNGNGQLGDNTTIERTSPVQVHGPGDVGFLTGIVSIASGAYHSIAIKNDGTVWAWGYNNYGNLGDGSTTNRYTPVQVSSLTGITSVKGGYYHTLALKSDGTVWAWGYNGYGQLGDNTTNQRNTPVQVHGPADVGFLNGITVIAAGRYFSLARKNNSTGWGWGDNGYGQLGDGTITQRTTPVQAASLGSNVKSLGAGYYHSLFIKNDGTVWGCGQNWEGDLGDGTTINRSTPVQMVGINNAVTVSGGYEHSVIMKSDGSFWACGYNYDGQLGDETFNNERHFAVLMHDCCSIQPLLALSDTCLDLGNIEINGTVQKTFNLINPSCATYTVTSITSSNAAFTASPTALILPKYSIAPVTVAFSPTALGSYTATLTIFNSVKDTTICLAGFSIPAPSVSVTPASFTVTINSCNDSITQPLTINNGGAGTLNYTVTQGVHQAAAKLYDGFETGNFSSWNVGTGTYTRTVTTNSPANGTYSFRLIGGNVAYYDGINRTFPSSTPNNVSFKIMSPAGSTGWTCGVVAGRVSDITTNNGIADSWIDNGTAEVYLYCGSGTYTIPLIQGRWYKIEYRNINYYTKKFDYYIDGNLIAGNLSFWNPNLTSLDVIHLMGYDAGQVSNFDEILIGNYPSWISSSPSSGTSAPSGSSIVNLKFKSVNVAKGTHYGNVLVNSNDPANPLVVVPCTLTVNGSPGIALNKTCLNYGNVLTGSSSPDSVLVTNTGCDTLKISSIVSSSGFFTVIPSSGNILPSQSAYVKVAFAPVAAATYTGTLTFYSNANDTAVCLTGTGVNTIPLSSPLSAGGYHSLALCRKCSDEFTWGNNVNGQLGDGTTTQRPNYVAPNIKNVIGVAAGQSHSVALKSNGTVWTWGYNGYGQIGDGTYTQRLSPVQIPSLAGTNFAVAAGQHHSLALKGNGTVMAWGYNTYGQIGDGTTINRTTPVPVSGLTGITSIDAGYYHTIALKSDGTVWTWGYNNYGQLGDNTTISKSTPVQVTGLSGIIAVAAGAYHSVALKSDGTVWAWGRNSNGQLGDNTTTQRTTPVQVIGLTGITAITGGFSYSVALKSDGTVWGWGYNGYGQLGDNTTTQRIAPVQAIGFTSGTAISAGDYHTLAMKNDSIVFAWGNNGNGQLGDGTTSNRSIPVQTKNACPVNLLDKTCLNYGSVLVGTTAPDSVLITNTSCDTLKISSIVSSSGAFTVNSTVGNLLYGQYAYVKVTFAPVAAATYTGTLTFYNNVKDTSVCLTGNGISSLPLTSPLAGGDGHSLALCKKCDEVFAWGANANGQLGDNTTTQRLTYVLPKTTDIAAIAAGNIHSMAVKNDGSVWAWGYNGYGQLGDGTSTQRTMPVQVTGLTGTHLAVAAGYYYSMALKGNGTVWTWGYNGYGQLGDGSTTTRYTPLQVSGLTGITAIASNNYHSLALKSDGTVWAWGYNGYGQLGDNTTIQKTTPVQVSGLTGIIAIAAGQYFSLALKNDGTVWAWGNNGNGQLGDNTTTQRLTPVQVSGLTGITAIAGGYYHSVALKNDGTVWAWGYNGYGQLGDNTITQRLTPVQVSGFTSATAVAAGDYHTLGMKNDSIVYAWGYNNNGQIGDGTLVNRWTPVQTKNVCPVNMFDKTCLNYGNQLTGSSVLDSVQITNTSCDTLQITSIVSSSGSFTVTPTSATVLYGQSVYIKVAFAPVAAATYTGTLTFYNTVKDTTVCLSGTGILTLPLSSPLAASNTQALALCDLCDDVFSWGYNAYGQLGDGTTTQRTIPILSKISGVSAIGSGHNFSLGLKSNGSVWSWGYNGNGELGDGTTTQRLLPVQVTGLAGTNIAIDAGESHSLSLKGNKTVWAWGYNGYGQLGDGSTTARTTPVQVSGLTGVTAVSGGRWHSLALKSDSTVWAWGYNSNGQLGDGTTTNRYTPVQVSGLTGIIAVYAGYHYSLAIKRDSTVWAWGYNGNGQLGDNTTTQRLTPVQVHGPGNVGFLTGITAISGGQNHSLALKNDGTYWAWGYNGYGQLGDNTITQRLTPVQVHGPGNVGFLTGITAIAGGYNYSLALKNDGTFWAWGYNGNGQLGDGTTTNKSTPVLTQGICPPQQFDIHIPLANSCPKFDTIIFGNNGPKMIKVYNRGCDTLRITSVTSDSINFTVVSFPTKIAPIDSAVISISLTPVRTGTVTTTIHVLNNDADTAFCLQGVVIPAPVISVLPSPVSYTLACCDSVTVPLAIANSGGSTLNWSLKNTLQFNGTSSYVQMNNSGAYDADQLTIEAWVYSTNYNQNGFIFEKGPVNTQYSLFFEGTNLCFRTYPQSGGCGVNYYLNAATIGITNGAWHHIAATYDGINKKVYVDGVLKGTSAWTCPLVKGQAGQIIGAYGGTGAHSYFYNGDISEVRVWNYARTQAQIVSNMNHPLINLSENGLVGYYPLSEGKGSILYDKTGWGMNGTGTNTTWVTDPASASTIYTYTPLSGTVPQAGIADTLRVKMKSCGLSVGTYTTQIVLATNDPTKAKDSIPCALTVVGAGKILLSKNCITMADSTMEFTTRKDSLYIKNTGCDTLRVTNITKNTSIYSFTPATFKIATGDSAKLIVTFAPVAVGIFKDTLKITSNDISNPLAKVCLSGKSYARPVIAFVPDSFNVTLNCSDTLIDTLFISNTGGSVLNWNLYTGTTIQEDFDPGIDGSVWSFNNGVVNTNCGSVTGNSLWMADNGVRIAATNDLNTIGGGSIKFYLKIAGTGSNCESADGGEDVVLEYSSNGGGLWNPITTFNENGYPNFTFINQAIPVGAQTPSTRFRWRQLSHSGNCCDHWALDDITINVLGNCGSFICVAPVTGTTPISSTDTVYVQLSSTGLLPGQYNTLIYITSNDPLNSPDTIPVNINVIGTAEFDLVALGDTLAPKCLYLDSIMAYTTSTDTVFLGNTGCDTLFLDSITISPSVYSLVNYSPYILPGDTGGFVVLFSPVASGTITGTASVYTNDLDTVFCLKGIVFPRPVYSSSPASLNISLACCDSIKDTLTVYNTGGSNLIYDIQNIGGLPNPIRDFLIIDHSKNKSSFSGYSTQTTSEAAFAGISYSQMIDNRIIYFEPDWSNYNNLTTNMSNLASYVNQGGVAVINIAGNIGNGTNIDPYGTDYSRAFTHESETFALPGHPYITGTPYGGNLLIPSNFNSWGSTDHGNLSNYPPGSEVVLTNSNGTSWIHYPYGSGHVILTTLTYGWVGPATPRDNLVDYAYYLSQNTGASWLTTTFPTPDTIVPADSSEISFTFNSCGLTVGTYTTSILVLTNDPLNPSDNIPVTLTVTGNADLELIALGDTVAPLCLDLDSIMESTTSNDTVFIANTGCDTLWIDSLKFSPSVFSLNTASVYILPGDSGGFVVRFSPVSSGTFVGTASLYTNELDTVFCVRGVSYPKPVQCHNPNSFYEHFLVCQDSILDTLAICNTGAGNLNYSLWSPYGRSVSLDGTNDNVDLGTWFNYQTFTIEMWVNPGGTQNQYADIIDNNHTGARSWVLQQNSTTLNQYTWGTNDGGAGALFSLTTNQWSHVTLVRDGISKLNSVYINGSLLTSYSGTTNIPYDGSQFVRLGRWGSGGRYWNGKMDEVRIFNKALTQAEIQATMRNTLSGNENSLIGYWNFDDSTATDFSPNTYNGTLVNGAYITAPNVQFLPAAIGTVSPAGTYSVQVKFKKAGLAPGSYTMPIYLTSNDPLNAVDTVVATVDIDALPPSPVAGSNSPVCSANNLSLTASTISGATYSWTGPNGFTSTLQNPVISSVTTAGSGTYSVTASVSGCPAGAPGITTVTVNPAPSTPSAGSNTPVCSGTTLSLTATSITGATYSWTGPNGYSSTLQNPTIPSVTTLFSGTYSVTATVPGCPATTAGTASVVINQTPVAPAASSNSPVCAGNDLSLTASTLGGASYSWTGPNSFTSTSQNPVITGVATNGTGTYSVSATENGCTGPKGTTAVTVNPPPAVPTAGSNSTVCSGLTLSLTANTIASAAYAWSGPNGFTSTLQNPTIPAVTTLASGDYSVTATVPGCPTTAAGTTSVTINQTPAAPAASSNSPVCAGNDLSLTASSAGTTYSWTGPNSFTSTTQDPVIVGVTIAGTGTYSVSATTNSCTGPIGTTTVTVNPPPSAPVTSSNSTVCSGNTLSLTASTIAGAVYSWTGPNSFTSTLQNPTLAGVSTSEAGTYSVTATVPGCPTGPAGTVSVSINQTPSAPAAGSSSPVCSGNTLSLTASTVAGATYSWNGPASFTSTAQDPLIASVTTAGSGTYSVSATVGGCPSPAGTVSVTIYQTPSAPSASSNSPICTGFTLSLTAATVPGATYSWTGPNSFTDASQNPAIVGVTSAEAGTYSVYVTVNGCSGPSATTTVVVNSVPTSPSAGSNSPVCSGNTLSLNATTIGGASYSWSGPNSFTSNLQNPNITLAGTINSGTYSVSAVVGGCPPSAPGTVSVTVNQTPSAPTAGSNSPVCVGTTLSLTASTVPGATYAWSGPNSFTDATQNPTIAGVTTSEAGTYSVTVTVTGCTGPAGTTPVIVNPPPAVPVAGNNSTLCSGQTLSLTASTVTGATYNWTGPNSFTSTQQNPTIAGVTTAANGTYSVTATTAGCNPSAAGTTTVTINQTPSAPVASSNSPVCAGSSLSLTASTTGTTYTWSGPNSFTSTSQDPVLASAATSDAGTYTVTATDLGCTGPAGTTSVVVNSIPSSPTATSNSPVCSGQTLNLFLSFTASNPTPTFTWNGPNAFTSTVQNPSIATVTTAASGTYSVTASVPGCPASAPGTTSVTVNETPAAPVAGSNTPVCSGNDLSLTASTITGVTYSWTGPGSFTSTSQNPVITGASTSASGTYTVTATNTGCTGPASTATVVVNQTPFAPSVANLSACFGGTIPSLLAGGSNIQWYDASLNLVYSGNLFATGQTAVGTYTYYASQTVNGCTSATASVTLTIDALPAPPNAGSDITICYGNPTPDLSATGSNIQWYNTSGTLLGSGSPYASGVTAPGSYTFIATQTNTVTTCQSAGDTVVLTINSIAPPLAPDVAVCAGNPIPDLTATGTDIKWYNSSLTLVYSGSPYATGQTAAGTYTYYVTQTNTVTTCVSPYDTVYLTISTQPSVPPVISDQVACAGTSIPDLTATTGTIINWYSDAGLTSLVYSGNPFATGQTTPGTYTFFATDSTPGCPESPSDPVTLTIHPQPATPVVNDTAACFGSTIPDLIFNGTNVQWYNSLMALVYSGTTFATGQTAAGTYTYYVTQTNTVTSCASAKDTVHLTIHALPAKPAALDTAVCSSAAIPNLTASGTHVQWHDMSGTLLFTGNSYATGQTAPGVHSYLVTEKDTVTGCESVADTSLLVILLSPPVPNANNVAVCAGNPIPSLTSTGANVHWYNNAALTNLVHIGNTYNTGQTTPGVYTYWVTDSLSGCVSSAADSVTLTINTLPGKPTANNVTLCFGTPAVMTSTGATPHWFSDATLINLVGAGSPFNTGITAVGTYTFYVTDYAAGCGNSPSDTAVLAINPNPLVTANTYSTTIIQGNSVVLTAYNAASYLWAPGGQTSASITASPTVTTTYTVTGTNAYGCSSSVTILVVVNPLGVTDMGHAVQDISIYPNPAMDAFTLEFNSTLQTPIDIYMTNMLGEKVRVLQGDATQGGGLMKHTYKINTSTFTEGVYNVEIVTGSGTVNRKVVLFR